MYAFITSISGELVAEYKDMKLYLSDAGIHGFGYGESVDLDHEPSDIWELADMLAMAAENK